tara:strand:+ start:103 stop:306 length:204 start_codon:yes stop_codon:yes gene_type:complete
MELAVEIMEKMMQVALTHIMLHVRKLEAITSEDHVKPLIVVAGVRMMQYAKCSGREEIVNSQIVVSW